MTQDSEEKLTQALDLLLFASHLDLTFIVRNTNGAADHLSADLSGSDSKFLVERSGELLLAFEHLAAKMIGLQPDQHDLLSLDALGFKGDRERTLLAIAAHATVRVGETGDPFTFPPMSSHQRRRLHLALAHSGLETASTGEGTSRSVVLFPRRA